MKKLLLLYEGSLRKPQPENLNTSVIWVQLPSKERWKFDG
jgi:hypothetical protein